MTDPQEPRPGSADDRHPGAVPQPAATLSHRERQAMLLCQRGALAEAEGIYRQLLAEGEASAMTPCNLAVICARTGRLAEAEHLLRQALEQEPDNAETRFNLGLVLKRSGRPEAAMAAYRQALALRPDHAEILFSLGIAHQEAGQHAEAMACHQQALLHDPHHARALHQLGCCHSEAGDHEEAIRALNAAIRHGHATAATYLQLGDSQQDAGRPEAALASYRKALELDPTSATALVNLGSAQQTLGQLDAAIASLRSALALNPQCAEAHFNLGSILLERDAPAAASRHLRRAIQLNPALIEAHRNLGVALHALARCRESIDTFNRALARQPDCMDLRWNRGLVLLLCGDYAQGWPDYEVRALIAQQPCLPHAQPSLPRWRGEELPPGEQLLVVSEQSLSDTMHFMRYVLVLRRQGLNVRFAAPRRLHSLIQASGLEAQPLTPEQAGAVQQGRWIPLLSIPRLLQVSPERPLLAGPHLRSSAALQERWRRLLAAESAAIVAINWQGDPSHERGLARGRSLPLEAFAPIAAIPEVKLLSLQKGWGSEQLGDCSFRARFVSCQAQVDTCWDFLETAAIISHCDLVITIDSAVAQLAGGLGQTTWLLLKQVPDWRWGLESETTFWYPSMRLFRQRVAGDWAEVMARVGAAVRGHVRSGGTGRRAAPAPAGEVTEAGSAGAGSAWVPLRISLAELLDRITILELREQHGPGEDRSACRQERLTLETVLQRHLENSDASVDPDLLGRLREINADLRQLRDAFEQRHRQGDHGEVFLRLARQISQQQERRRWIKAAIDRRS